jgi:hypothetical protein
MEDSRIVSRLQRLFVVSIAFRTAFTFTVSALVMHRQLGVYGTHHQATSFTRAVSIRV